MTDKFESILEFTRLKKVCGFCKTPLRAHLTNFVGLVGTGIPIINSPLVGNRFEFKIEHTTPSFKINADVFIDADKNVVLFDNFTNGELPAIDEYVVRQTFEDYRPHIELYCPSKSCGLNYHISSYWFKLVKVHKVMGAWSIQPFGLYLEGVRIRNYVVHNYANDKNTHIYSRNNEDAQPLEVPLVDFSTMSKEKLITRIQTIVTFS